MFFYIGQDCPIKSVTKVADNLFLDQGWKVQTFNDLKFWYKGYSTDCVLSENIETIFQGYRPNGKWAVITESGNIIHPTLRGFPIYISDDKKIKTNIPLPNLNLEHYQTYKILKKTTLSLEEASRRINEVLVENIKNFFTYNKIEKLNVLFSAGIDTLTLWAIIDNLGYDYNLHINTPKPKNSFRVTQEYKSDLIDICRQNFWGYQMTSCFIKENWYITGFYSERVQLREVSQGHTIANYLGKKLYQIPKRKDYLYYFLQRPSTKINKQPKYTTLQEVYDWCNESVYYDHQMWHIDNNFHFSPFYDIRITEIVNQMSLDDVISNSLNALIQKNIIEYHRPDFMCLLSDYKNEGNIWNNYYNNFSKIQLRESISKFIS